MSAKFNNGTRVAGVIAYQDSNDSSQFYYFPQTVYSVLGENLSEFLVTYWGISDSFYDKDKDGKYQSMCGGIMGGKGKIDITSSQQSQIEARIKNDFGIQNPKILPLYLSDVKVKPTFGQSVLGTDSGGDAKFPDNIILGSDFNFVVGAPNVRFASVVAARNRAEGLIVNPQFGVNITGEAEFRGEPWKAEIECDLSQVWSYVRTNVKASVSWGWFTLGSGEYENIVRDLYKDSIIKSNYVEGSIYTEKYGRQMFEEAKKIFDLINTNAADGTSFFKFEPIKDPQSSKEMNLFSLFGGFSVSINVSYTKSVFKQKIHYQNIFEYSGNFKASMPIGMSLAVSCNTTTNSNFIDLNDSSQPCMTDLKLRIFNDRIKKEELKKEPLYKELQSADGKLDSSEYGKLLRKIDNLNASETFAFVSSNNNLFKELRGESFDDNFGFTNPISFGLGEEGLYSILNSI